MDTSITEAPARRRRRKHTDQFKAELIKANQNYKSEVVIGHLHTDGATWDDWYNYDLRMRSDYIVFVDESGDHSLVSIDPQYPVFVLAFCVMPIAPYVELTATAMRRLKFELFGHDVVVLHEREIRRKLGAFSKLDERSRGQLLERLNTIIGEAEMTLIAVVIDKPKHKARYVMPEHPYNLALMYGLERVNRLLDEKGQGGRTTSIVFEARGPKEDRELEDEFQRVCAGGNHSSETFHFEMVMADKKTNSEGLQLADLVARPIGTYVLHPDQENRCWDILETKLFKGPVGAVHGHGLKIFP